MYEIIFFIFGGKVAMEEDSQCAVEEKPACELPVQQNVSFHSLQLWVTLPAVATAFVGCSVSVTLVAAVWNAAGPGISVGTAVAAAILCVALTGAWLYRTMMTFHDALERVSTSLFEFAEFRNLGLESDTKEAESFAERSSTTEVFELEEALHFLRDRLRHVWAFIPLAVTKRDADVELRDNDVGD